MLDTDSDDEWFLDSIKRYKELIMFDTGDPVIQIELCNGNTMCALTEKGPNKRIISVLSLPSKLSDTSQGCKQTNSDLKIKSGMFTSSVPTRILVVYECDRLVSSQKNVNGVVLYHLNYSDAEQITVERVCDFPLMNPDIALLEKDKILMANDSSQPACVGDLNSECTLNSIDINTNISDIIMPSCLSRNIIALLLKSTGSAYLYDSRIADQKEIGFIKGEEFDSLHCTWKVFTNYSFQNTSQDKQNLYLLSNSGLLKCYDLRYLNGELIKKQLPLKTTSSDYFKINFRAQDDSVISVSGFDDSIYLFNSSSMVELFKHDGHPRTEHCEKSTCVSDHFWYANEYVISCALNNSINCWVPNLSLNI